MSLIRISTNFNIDITFPAAPFHRRLLAWLIDVIVIISYLFGLAKIMRVFSSDPGQNDYLQGFYILLFVVPLFTYHLFCEILLKGQSIGKRIMQLRVINENGGRPAISQVIIRWLIRTSDLMVMIILLNGVEASQSGGLQFLWRTGIAFLLLATDVILVNATEKHQRLGDLFAHTILIQTKQKADFADTIFLQVKDNYVPSFPQVMQLSDRDINALKGILDTARRQHDYDLADRASEKLKNHLNIQTSLSPFDFLEVLLKDYNFLTAH
jgi:uncharacterized RDD family membrane protein YckC